MTRATDFARKRTYVQAELNHRGDDADGQQVARDVENDSKGSGSRTFETHKRQKKRRENAPPPSHADSGEVVDMSNSTAPSSSSNIGAQMRRNVTGPGDEAKPEVVGEAKRKRCRGAIRAEYRRAREEQARKDALLARTDSNGQRGEASTEHAIKQKRKRNRGRDQSGRMRVKEQTRRQASVHRKLKHEDQRSADTTCFACREKGHAAKDCTKSAVGVCYRCGSRKHTLSLCKEPADPSNPLPFVSCFVCSGNGHLASSCPQNLSKGVYPNGGSCKLCGETTHLAKNCKLRKQEITASAVLLGTGDDAGADEDDFHSLKRLTGEVDKSELVEQRTKKMAKVCVGAHSGVVKSFGKRAGALAQKVVYF